MTGICGLTGSDETQVSTTVEQMLVSMEQRGTVTHTISLKISDATIGVGICEKPANLAKVHDELTDDSLMIDGRFWDKEQASGVINVIPRRVERLTQVPGSFSFLALTENGLAAGRDLLGQKPLYFASDDEGNYVFASLTKALNNAGFHNIQPVPPGTLIQDTKGLPRSPSIQSSFRAPVHETSEDTARQRIGELLLEAVHKIVPEGSAVSFSGGIDSSLVAHSIKRIRVHADLVTVGLEGQPELGHAKEAAREIGLQLWTRPLTEEEILATLPSVVEIVESKDPTIVSTALPFYFACEEARRMGADTVVAGQLSDELFGGYARFERTILDGNPQLVEEQMWQSVLDASTNDFAPGDKIAVACGLELVCPFAYLPLVEYALSLPVDLKLRVGDKAVVRKYILRRLGENWGLPRSVVEKPKKAFQYSTGVHGVLEREAKRRKMAISEMLASYLPSRQLYASASQ